MIGLITNISLKLPHIIQLQLGDAATPIISKKKSNRCILTSYYAWTGEDEKVDCPHGNLTVLLSMLDTHSSKYPFCYEPYSEEN